MNFINPLNDKYFTLNGIQYFRNYVSAVHGNKVEIYNCYERKDVLVSLTHFSEFNVGGSTYSSASELQAAMLDITYSRLTIGDSSVVDQNNVGRVINVGNIGPAENVFFNAASAVANKLNTMQITITAKQTPIIITAALLVAANTYNYVSKRYKYLFKQGKGNWGLNGTPISWFQLELITVENYLIDDLLSEPNAIINNLGEIPDGNFIATANASSWDFSESGFDGESGIKTYYFSYETDGVLYFAQFVGIPDIYGAEYTAQFTNADFVSTTDSRITDVPTFVDVLAQGGNTNVSQLVNNGDGTSPYATVDKVNSLSVAVNQATAEMFLKNSNDETLATVNLGFLNNEGTTFFYNSTTENLELKNDAGEILSVIPVSAFVSNLMQSVDFNASSPQTLEFKDASGDVVDSVAFTINNIQGLQVALNGKANTNGSNASGTWPIAISGNAYSSSRLLTVGGGEATFNWDNGLDNGATPTWMWGADSYNNTWIFSPLSFPVSNAMQVALDLKAVDTSVLHTTGDETKTGNLAIEGNNKGYYLGTSGQYASILYNSNGNLDITPRSGYNTIFTAGNVGILGRLGVGAVNNTNPNVGDPSHQFDVTANLGDTFGYLMQATTYANSPGLANFHIRKARGTAATPLATLNGDFFASMGFRGHDGTNFAASSAAIQAIATENTTPTANGTRLLFQTTPNGNHTGNRIDALNLNHNGEATFYRNIVTGAYDGTGLKLQKATDTGNSHIRFYDETGQAKGYLGIFGTSNNMILDAAASTLNITAPITSITGNVGIATETPDIFSRSYSKTLGITSTGSTGVQINGTSQSDFDMGIAGSRTFNLNTTDTESTITSFGNKKLFVAVNGAIRQTYNNDGNIGINTTSPTYTLDINGISRTKRTGVNGGGLAGVSIIASDAKTVGDGILQVFQGHSSSDTEITYAGVAVNIEDNSPSTPSGSISFKTYNAGNAVDALKLSKEGRVGVGQVGSFPAMLNVNGGDEMTAGYNRTALLRANYPFLVFNSIVGDNRYSGISYDTSSGLGFWVNGTSTNVPGTATQSVLLRNNGTVLFNGEVTVPDGTVPTSAVNKSQITTKINTTAASTYAVTTGKGLLTITSFTGTTSTFTLEPASAGVGKELFIVNKGSGNVTVNTTGAAIEIWEMGNLINNFVIYPGDGIRLYNDGTYIKTRY